MLCLLNESNRSDSKNKSMNTYWVMAVYCNLIFCSWI